MGSTDAGGADLLDDDALTAGDGWLAVGSGRHPGEPWKRGTGHQTGCPGSSDYWKPTFYLLKAAGFDVWLVNTHA